MPLMQRVLSPLVEVRRDEVSGALLMFAYSFLAMTAYNIIQPLTRSNLISSLGAVNVPWVILGSGLFIGLLMVGYTRAVTALPRRWALPITQIAMAGIMVLFWALFRRGGDWVSVAFYIWGLILGILLTSQFWTLANGIYDPRQAKRLFGFIGGGITLGGMTGAGITLTIVERVGSNALLLVSAGTLLTCATIVSIVLGRTNEEAATAAALAGDEKGVSIPRAIGLLRGSRQIQLIAVVIAFGSLGAALIDQQLNMAAEIFKGEGETDSMSAFLAQVRFSLSAAAFVIQVWVTPRIHQYLGIGFALLILPTNLAATASVILLNAALWAPAAASVLDRSFRYTVDKTTREVLFLPLPTALRQDVKPFVDVTVDRVSRGVGALLILILIQPWGFSLAWYQLSVVSLLLAGIWYLVAFGAKREYLSSFRKSLQEREMAPQEIRLSGADLTTIEALVQELSHPQPARVVYAIDMLESLGKSHLVTPLLLFHDAWQVRERALRAIGTVRRDIASEWTPQIRRALADPEAAVRVAALGTLSVIAHEDAASLARPMLADPDPRIRATAALALAASEHPEDIAAAETTLTDIVSSTSEGTKQARQDVAAALAHSREPRLQRLLVPLLYDPSTQIADTALESVRRAGAADFIFVPALISLLRNRHLKGRAREVLVSYGEPVIDTLAYFMADVNEDEWIRRHVPSTLALIPTQRSVDALVAHLEDADGFLRYKVISALSRLRRADDSLAFPAETITMVVTKEARQFYKFLTLHQNLLNAGVLKEEDLLSVALREKMRRGRNRIFLLLGLIHPPGDMVAAEWTLTHGEPRARASASEYLDNLLAGPIRRMVMPIVEDLPTAERIRRANVLINTRPRDAEETLLQLVNDEDQVIAACAIDLVGERQIWALTPDIEHVLAHRDVRHWFVFEAASWTLAEQRLSAERRRQKWLEPLPAVVLASQLRRLPLFASLPVEDLFRIASASRQVRHEAGTVLLTERSVPEMLHVLLDGDVTVTGSAAPPLTVCAPAALGFSEALQARPMRRSVRTEGVAVTLAMTSEELRTQLAYNPELVRGLFATMAPRRPEGTRSQINPTGAARELAKLASDGIVPVEKVLALEHVPVFAHLSAEEALRLTDITHTVKMSEGDTLFRATDPPTTWLILDGEVRLEATETLEATIAVGGDTVGSFSALAGPRVGRTATVTKSGIALRIDRDELFEMLGDRPEMLRQVFAGVIDMAGSPQPPAPAVQRAV